MNPAPHPRTAGRLAAVQILTAVEANTAVLAAALENSSVPPEARAFVHEVVSGTLRRQGLLDYTLAPLLRKPSAKLDPPVRAALRLALYERAVLATPVHVVADQYAGLMRALKLGSAVAFVNAIGRRLPRELRAPPEAAADPALHLSVAHSHPLWLVRRWLQRLGFEGCASLCQANNAIAPLALRVNTLRVTRDDILQRLRGRGLAATAGHYEPDSIVVADAGSPTGWPEWREGLIIAQDEAAQLVSRLAAPQRGQRVIDAAAAPGGKTTHLAQLMGDQGQVVACDIAPGRLKLVQENARRLGLQAITTRAGDFVELAPALPPADVVLLDAPCSGTGTFRRRPDARWRKSPAQLNELTRLQRALFDAAATAVKPGGRLVYATCSLEPEENEEQVDRFLKTHAGWAVEPAGDGFAPTLVTSTGCLQTWPHLHGCDGMFAARLCREN